MSGGCTLYAVRVLTVLPYPPSVVLLCSYSPANTDTHCYARRPLTSFSVWDSSRLALGSTTTNCMPPS